MKRVHILKKEQASFISEFNRLLGEKEVPYLLVLSEKDKVPNTLVRTLRRVLDHDPALSFATPKTFFQCPDRLTGVMLRKSMVKDGLRREDGSLCEAALLLPLLAAGTGKRVRIKGYEQGDPGNGKYTENPDCFKEDWYFRDLRDVLIPMLENARDETGRIPAIYQRYALFTLRSRLDANMDNRNRRALLPEETDVLIALYADVLSRIDDEEILNSQKAPVYSGSVCLRRMLLRIKYRMEYVPLTYRPTLWNAEEKKLVPVRRDGGSGHPDDHRLAEDYTAYFKTKDDRYMPVVSTHQAACNILLMDLVNGNLEIDGTLPDYFREEAGHYEFRAVIISDSEEEKCDAGRKICNVGRGTCDTNRKMCDANRKKCGILRETCKTGEMAADTVREIITRPVWNEGYSLTKYFGRSAYKRFSFHASVPLLGEEALRLFFVPARDETGRGIEIPIAYPSHTSRLAAWPHHSYWHAIDRAGRTNALGLLTDTRKVRKPCEAEKICKPDYLLRNIYRNGTDTVCGIHILPYKRLRQVREEAGFLRELLASFSLHRFRFFLLRSAWIVTKPYYRRKRIWFYMDKIYKGGDSSEYLYRYAARQKDGITHRYLVDRACPDADRLLCDGYDILPRGSFRHRLDFLNAEKVFATNSTVFAFNDYYLENSRYIRGIPDFDVICLQHGLSVQKIAVAQNRLRDNTRLYCCAAQAEIENLSRPVYNYPDPRALCLTGIPRYDGLRDAAERIILISPTWRMQSAMPVTKNEGVERDYNPGFKDTPYYKIYSSILTDSRLTEAAKRTACRIVYLMHPITSPQAKDFAVESPVEIVPATADMRYEEYLCKGALMVTDYSGVQFDFAWMKKPLVYFQPPELEGHYEEGTFHYDTMAFGEIVTEKDALVDTLIRYMENGFTMPALYRERVQNFFVYHDHENTRRVYESVTENRPQRHPIDRAGRNSYYDNG